METFFKIAESHVIEPSPQETQKERLLRLSADDKQLQQA
jgi:hypothetical protein